MRVTFKIVCHITERTVGRYKCGKWSEVEGDTQKRQHISMVEFGPHSGLAVETLCKRVENVEDIWWDNPKRINALWISWKISVSSALNPGTRMTFTATWFAAPGKSLVNFDELVTDTYLRICKSASVNIWKPAPGERIVVVFVNLPTKIL